MERLPGYDEWLFRHEEKYWEGDAEEDDADDEAEEQRFLEWLDEAIDAQKERE